jgi:hypothetical protein
MEGIIGGFAVLCNHRTLISDPVIWLSDTMRNLLYPQSTFSDPASSNVPTIPPHLSATYTDQEHAKTDHTVQPISMERVAYFDQLSNRPDGLSAPSPVHAAETHAGTSSTQTISRAGPLTPMFRSKQPDGTILATAPAHLLRGVTQAIMREQLKRLKEEFAGKLRHYLQKVDPTRRRREAEEHDRLMQLLVEQHRLWEEGKLCRDLADEAARIKAVEAARVQLQAEVAWGSLEEDFQSYQASMENFIAEMKECDTLAKFEAATSAMPRAGLHHGSQ